MSGSAVTMSFVVCTHNGGDRLAAVVMNLAERYRQHPVEIVVVDNASVDGAVDRLRHSAPAGPPAIRFAAQEKLGLAHARRAGFEAARGEILVFVDDDNLLADGWFETLMRVFEAKPEVAACGGYGIGCLPAIPIPQWFEHCCAIFAVGGQADHAGDATVSPGRLWGAGLAVKRDALAKLFDQRFEFRATGRSGRRLLAGEDTELCFALRLAGWRLWYEPRLVFFHLLEASRFELRNLIRLHRGFGAGSVMLDPHEWVLGNTERFPTRRHRSVSWQLALALRTIASPSVVIRHNPFIPRDFVVAKYYGRLVQLLRMGLAYDRSFDEIERAPWRAAPTG